MSSGFYTQRYVGTVSFTLVAPPEKAREAVRVFKEEFKKFGTPGYFSD